MTSETGLKVGDKVTCNGYTGTVVRVCEWNNGLVEVGLPGGVVCVSDSECQKLSAQECVTKRANA